MSTPHLLVLAYELTAYQEVEVPAGLTPEAYRKLAIEKFAKTSEHLDSGVQPHDLVVQEDTVWVNRIVYTLPSADDPDHPALADPITLEELYNMPQETPPALSTEAWALSVRFGETLLGYEEWKAEQTAEQAA